MIEREVSYAYSEEANGWVSEDIVLTGDISLFVSLKEMGRVVVKRRQSADTDVNPKIWVSPMGTEFKNRIWGDTPGRILQVITSTEPKEIKYANI